MMNNKHTTKTEQWVVAALFTILIIGILYLFVSYAEPDERKPGHKFDRVKNEQVLVDALSEANLQQRVQEIKNASMPAGSRQIGRFTGSQGFYQTEALITNAFKQAGLEVVTQEFQVPVPVTEYCEILDEQNKAIPGVQIYPFEPSGLLPTALPREGVSGSLLLTQSSNPNDLVGKNLEGTIVVNDGFDCSWQTLASLGVKAVVYKDPNISLIADPDAATNTWKAASCTNDQSFPRFYITGSLNQFAGKQVTIRCKVAWQNKTVRNIIGVLRGGQSNPKDREALCVTSYYDSYSIVPELAPGAEQSLSLAAMLELAQGMARYKDTMSRDMLFVAIAAHSQTMAGAKQLMEAANTFSKDLAAYRSFEQRKSDEEQSLAYAKKAITIVESSAPWSTQDNSSYREKWLKEGRSFRKWFEDRYTTVAGEIDLERKEDVITTRLAWMKAGKPTYRDDIAIEKLSDKERADKRNQHPLLKKFLEATTAENRAAGILSVPFWQVAKELNIPAATGQTLFEAWAYREKAKAYFNELVDYHSQQIQRLQDNIAVRDLFHSYQKTLTVNLELYSGGAKAISDLSVQVGYQLPGTVVEPQSTNLRNAIVENVPKNGSTSQFVVSSWGSLDTDGSESDKNPFRFAKTRIESTVWYRCGRLAFTVMNKAFFPAKLGTPEDDFNVLPVNVIAQQLPPLGKALLSIAHGNIDFKSIPYNRELTSYSGSLYASAGLSPLPTHRVGKNTFVRISDSNMRPAGGTPAEQVERGIWLFPVVSATPYGDYSVAINAENYKWAKLDIDAFRFDDNGKVQFAKDLTAKGQSVLKNEQLPVQNFFIGNSKAANVGMFRCEEVACYQRINPKTLNAFPKFNILLSQGLAELEQYYNDNITVFMPPDSEFYIGMMDGSAYNPDVQTYRAFMLNSNWPMKIAADEPDVFGKGYLAADSANIAHPYFDAAASMLRTNDKRLELQRRYKMADEQMLTSHNEGIKLLNEAWKLRQKGESILADNMAGRSLSYAINNHPVIRTKVSNAVVGIIWYLILLVPFVFFFEKLVFGFTDIRKQLLAHGVIFIAVFALLWYFHPAFRMVRSAFMILLGFLILLLASIVTLMVTGRFQEIVKKLRRREGNVEGADVSRGGVIGTAFMLGLNNMRRRKVRTGLTCVTLVLITFVMICFTSVTTDLVDVEYATGPSPSNGLFRRDPNFQPLSEAELNSFKQIYGLRYPVTSHRWLTSALSFTGAFSNPKIDIDRQVVIANQTVPKRVTASSLILMEWNEPEFTGIDKYLLTNRGWFPRPAETEKEKILAQERGILQKNYAIIPDEMAKGLELSVDEVNNGHPTVMIRNTEYEVLGIFDSSLLTTKYRGMDGQSILPYNLNDVRNLSKTSAGLPIVPRDINRLEGRNVIITNFMPPIQAGEVNILVSCSVLFPKQPYQLRADLPIYPGITIGEQRALVSEFLERIGTDAFYAIDGFSYYGRRTRAKTAQGLIELLIPILIASLTVFNTMRGSVYERKDEIFVYNAVGIAPNHIFFMFMAEALVYAVMGAMLGYLLSQAMGTIMTMANITTGLNADYSAIETIYASLAIVASVMLSTLVPARTASKLALPSDEMRWSVPTADGDVMKFNLPFTFNAVDRIAIISYFYRWLDANGEGSSGSFYCSPPEIQLYEDATEERSGGLIPAITANVWLKPFDLGVSQRIIISLPTDPETGEYIANIVIERMSGTTSAWNRTVMPFLTNLRKQFLNWRAVTPEERNEMSEEAKALFMKLQTRETVNV